MNTKSVVRIFQILFVIAFVVGTLWVCPVRAQQATTLEWQVLLDSLAQDEGYGIAVDTNGNSYVVGYSRASWGAPIRIHAGGQDAFASKLDSNGNLIWNTFLGSSDADVAFDVAIDQNGNIYVGGVSKQDWGDPIRHNTNQPYYQDAFVAKLDNNGNLLWNTFLGSLSTDDGYGIAVDGEGNVYMVGGSLYSWGMPLNSPNGFDAYVAKLNTNGQLLWNIYLGGPTNSDQGRGIAVDQNGDIYATGFSNSNWGSPIQNYTGGADIFVAKLDGTGTVQWNTFLGSTNNEYSQRIKIDEVGNVYITGDSYGSWGLPINPWTGGQDIFAAKLDNGGNLQWNTFLGSSSIDYGRGIVVSDNGEVHLIGRSDSSWGMPLNPHAGNGDIVIATVDNNGALLWNTFYGTPAHEQGAGIGLDTGGNILITGIAGVYATYEILVAKFSVANTPPIADAGGPYTVDWGTTLTLDGSGSTDPDNNILNYEWDLDNDGEYDDATGATPTNSFNQFGEHIIGLLVTDDGGLSGTDTATVTVTDPTTPTVTPMVSGTLGNDGWYISDVTVSWEVSDLESGIASSDGCDTTMLTLDTSGDTLTCSATNGAGLTNSASATVKIDKNSPLITWVSDINNGDSFYFGSVPPEPACTASDNLSGVDGSCSVSGYVSTVGSHTLTAMAKDYAGNETTETRGYTVFPWTLTGFYPPVDMGGVYNTVKGGSTVPLKFEIFAGSTELTDVASVKSFTYAQTSCDATAITDEVETTATGNTSLRYEDGQFIYNWKTPKSPGKCYRVTMTAIDGSSLVAYFKLK